MGSPASRAVEVASLMVGTKRSREYCLELVCADFLAGRGEESSPEEILMVIHRLVHLLPREYQARLAGQSGSRELEQMVRGEPLRSCREEILCSAASVVDGMF